MNTFESLYRDYYKFVIWYFTIKLKVDKHTAQDLCSTTFVKVGRKLESFNSDKAELTTWISKIALNVYIDYTRTKNYKLRHVSEPMETIINSDNEKFEPETNIQSDTNIELKELTILINNTIESFRCKSHRDVCKLKLQDYTNL